MVEISLDENRALALAHRFAGRGQAIQKPALLEDRRIGRIQIFRLFPRKGPSAKSDHSSPFIADRKEQPVPETVVGAFPFLTRLQQARLDQEIGGGRRTQRVRNENPLRASET